MALVVIPLLLLVGVLAWRGLRLAYLRDTAEHGNGPTACANCGETVDSFMGVRDRPIWVYCTDFCAVDHAESRSF